MKPSFHPALMKLLLLSFILFQTLHNWGPLDKVQRRGARTRSGKHDPWRNVELKVFSPLKWRLPRDMVIVFPYWRAWCKRAEICPPWTQRVEKLIIGFSCRKVESGWILGKGQVFLGWLWEDTKTITWWGVKGRSDRNRNSLSYFGDALEEFTNPLTLFSPNYSFHFPSQ